MAEKTAEKPAGEKLILFNHSRNPHVLKPGPNGEPRIFAVGKQIECLDREEYDFLKNYKGIGTTQQVAPGLATVIDKMSAEKKELLEELEQLRTWKAKFEARTAKAAKGK